MQKTNSILSNTDESLHQALLSSVDTPAYWEQTLSILAKECKAIAAIITLRDKRNAQIVISTQMASEFHTPYVSGFPKEMVEIYISKFSKTDPWSKIQSVWHPYEPTLMSHHLPIADFSKTDLGEWVSNDIFNDTVVVEIGSSKNNWTALNLYFMNQNADQAIHVRDQLNHRLPDIRKAWTLSREFQQTKGLKKLIAEYIATHPCSLILLNAEGHVISISSKTQELISKGIAYIHGRTKRFQISSELTCDLSISGLVDYFEEENSNGKGYSVKIDQSNQNLTSTGELLGMTIISIEHWRDNEVEPWEHRSLTEREKILLLTIAQTNRIKEAARVLGISERRNRQVWAQVQEKLGGITKEELVIRHKKQKNANKDKSGKKRKF